MKITLPIKITLDIKRIEEDLYRAHVDYRHPIYCTLCNRELIHQEWMSVVRCANKDYTVCRLCLEPIRDTWQRFLDAGALEDESVLPELQDE